MWNGLSLLAASELGAMLKRNLRALSFYVASALMAIIGLVFVLQAAYSWLLFNMSPVSASLVIAAAMLVLAGILILVGHFAGQRKNGPSALASAALVAAPLATRMIGRKVSYGTIAVAGVVAVGVIIGRMIAKD
jgi:hypothetical protein